MPQEPKKRHSRARKGKRRASIKLLAIEPVACLNCGSQIVAHTVCKNCGYYKGIEVIKKVVKEKRTSEDKSVTSGKAP